MAKSKARNDAEANKRPLRHKSLSELATVAIAKDKNRQQGWNGIWDEAQAEAF